MKKAAEIGEIGGGGQLPHLCDIDACDATFDENYVSDIRTQWIAEAREYNDDEDNEEEVGLSNENLHEGYDLSVNSAEDLCEPDEINEEHSCGLAITNTTTDKITGEIISVEMIVYSRRIDEYIVKWNSNEDNFEEGRRLNRFDVLVQILLHEHRHAVTRDHRLPRSLSENLAQRFAYNAYKKIWKKDPPLEVDLYSEISPNNPDYHWILDSVYGEFEIEDEEDEEN